MRNLLYGCSGYHDRGRTICGNGADIPLEDADGIVLEAMLDDVLTPGVLSEAVDEALTLLQSDTPQRAGEIERRIGRLEREKANLVRAIAAGGELDDLVAALQERDARLTRLAAEREGHAARNSRHSQIVPAGVKPAWGFEPVSPPSPQCLHDWGRLQSTRVDSCGLQ